METRGEVLPPAPTLDLQPSLVVFRAHSFGPSTKYIGAGLAFCVLLLHISTSLHNKYSTAVQLCAEYRVCSNLLGFCGGAWVPPQRARRLARSSRCNAACAVRLYACSPKE